MYHKPQRLNPLYPLKNLFNISAGTFCKIFVPGRNKGCWTAYSFVTKAVTKCDGQ